eukprot:1370187-Amorphochlora_amoeboformis.AAC.1
MAISRVPRTKVKQVILHLIRLVEKGTRVERGNRKGVGEYRRGRRGKERKKGEENEFIEIEGWEETIKKSL